MTGAARAVTRAAVLAFVVGAALVVLTWPLYREPRSTVLDTVSLYGPAAFMIQRDINLTLWALSWGAHALVTAPWRVFHTNAFYPAPYTLALSEHMLGNQPLYAPVYLATGNPVLAHQATLLLSFVLSALTMAAWVRWHTRDDAAAAAAGILYAFAPFRIWQIGNLHVVSTQWLPLVPLGIDLALAGGRPRLGAAMLALALATSTLCSYYIGYAAFVLAAVYLGVRLWTERDLRPHARAALGGIAVGGLAVVALSVPYLMLQLAGIIPRRRMHFEGLAFMAAARDGVLGGLWRFLWPNADGIPVFLGFPAIGLGALGAVLWRRPPRGALLVAGAAGYTLVVGPFLVLGTLRVPLPYWLAALVVPGFSAMRVPQRFAMLASVAACGLAGLGLAAMRTRLGERRVAAAVLPIAVMLAAVALAWPGRLRPYPMPVGDALPPDVAWLRTHGEGAPMIELPIGPDVLFEGSMSLYRSIGHWLPMANGYTPYAPPSYREFMAAAHRMPSADALAALRAVAPLRWVVVRHERIPEEQRHAWDGVFADAGVPVAADLGGVVIYRLPDAAPAA